MFHPSLHSHLPRLAGLAGFSISDGRPKKEIQITQPSKFKESESTSQRQNKVFVFWKGRSCLRFRAGASSGSFTLSSRPTTDVLALCKFPQHHQKPLQRAIPTHLLKIQQHLDTTTTTTNIMSNRSKKGLPKSGKPSTASTGRKLTFSSRDHSSQEESEPSDFEDELDAYYTPSRGGKGNKLSKKLTAQDFLKDHPVTRNKSRNLKIRFL